ncbi:7-carboxy-7-deazaguanine synthase QueE [Patescibacteria group bacterium]|nr:7-carboxy-7-deazaguanine synthase QueE [Patescibacteria group bacterium]MBU1683255.1 7-carboxy-7-deazaguanine synthase QueE [Patescibacteria group bacterium]
MKLIVSEVFYSIQGEGPNIGKPAVFLRLSGCNLRCGWCDTKHAITITNTITSTSNCNSISYGCAQVLKNIKKYPCRHLVITGGEPTLQQDALIPLLEKLKDYYIEIETNGTIRLKINKYLEQINCSPKLASSGNTPYPLKIKPTNNKVVYKFVVADKKDLKEIKAYIKSNKIPDEKVWLMPEGVNKKIVQEISEWIIEICKKEGYNFSPRLHILLNFQ